MTMMPTIFDRSSPDLHKSNSNDISALSDETPPADHLKTQPRPKSFRIYNYSMTVKVNDAPGGDELQLVPISLHRKMGCHPLLGNTNKISKAINEIEILTVDNRT